MHEGYIYLAGVRYCPKCTKVEHFEFDSTYAGRAKNPAILVKRINNKTKDWFYGCPNFPKCKYTQPRPKTRREIDLKTWAWANARR